MNKNEFLTESFLRQLAEKTWDIQKAKDWYAEQPWLVGCNYIPSTAINQLEMFQDDTYQPARIDEELGWAESLGFNVLRIYLHFLLWQADSKGIKKKIDQTLEICHKHHMKVLFVFFDDCWNQNPELGVQPQPIPGIHNSGWAASPGREQVLNDKDFPDLKNYVQDILDSFTNDIRILGWDMYNEPGNFGMGEQSLPLLNASLSWAREIDPSQPITIGTWRFPARGKPWKNLYEICIKCSDIITFHHYLEVRKTLKLISELKAYDRPIICTEYMARTNGNLFESHLPIFKKEKIGAINWGLVAGKTQTIYSWTSKKGDPEPELWYHDIFHEDGTPYSQKEIDFIKSIIKNT
jgi:hypothetical protein